MSESGKWRCPYCDGLNSPQDDVCQICGDGRRGRSKRERKAGDQEAMKAPPPPSLPKLTFIYPPLLIYAAIIHHSAALAQAGFATFAKHNFRTFCARRRASPSRAAPRRARRSR